MKDRAKNLATTGVLTALTLVLSLLENALPPLIPTIPYFKIGLANLGILFILVVCGTPQAYVATIVKCLVVAVFSGAISSVLYSLPASVLSLGIMWLLLDLRKVSLRFVSICGALTHTTVQLLVACIVTGGVSVLLYSPYLYLLAVVSGAAIGYIDWLIIRRYPFDKSIDKK